MARVLALSSHVVRGSIGLQAIGSALRGLGHEVWALPTILLSNHPGHRSSGGVATPVDRIDVMIDALEANGWLGEIDAVITGYLPSVAHVAAAVRALQSVKIARPDMMFLCDPVLGDDPKGLYIAADTAAALRDRLVPLADILTPNRFELAWLTGRTIASPADAIAAAGKLKAGQLKAGTVIATSVPATPGNIANICVTQTEPLSVEVPRLDHVPHGTGDYLSGLYLGHVLGGASADAALRSATSGVAAAIAASAGRDELLLD